MYKYAVDTYAQESDDESFVSYPPPGNKPVSMVSRFSKRCNDRVQAPVLPRHILSLFPTQRAADGKGESSDRSTDRTHPKGESQEDGSAVDRWVEDKGSTECADTAKSDSLPGDSADGSVTDEDIGYGSHPPAEDNTFPPSAKKKHRTPRLRIFNSTENDHPVKGPVVSQCPTQPSLLSGVTPFRSQSRLDFVREREVEAFTPCESERKSRNRGERSACPLSSGSLHAQPKIPVLSNNNNHQENRSYVPKASSQQEYITPCRRTAARPNPQVPEQPSNMDPNHKNMNEFGNGNLLASLQTPYRLEEVPGAANGDDRCPRGVKAASSVMSNKRYASRTDAGDVPRMCARLESHARSRGCHASRAGLFHDKENVGKIEFEEVPSKGEHNGMRQPLKDNVDNPAVKADLQWIHTPGFKVPLKRELKFQNADVNEHNGVVLSRLNMVKENREQKQMQSRELPSTKHSSSVDNRRNIITVKNKDYCVLSKLGVGGSSQVYQVIDMETSQLRAVKCVNLADTDASTAKGYLNEIEHLCKLQKSNRVIKLFDHEFVTSRQVLYVVMEKGDVDLSTLLKSRSKVEEISMPMIIYYWTEMLHAVRDIHEYGIIHADLKPANFLLVCGRLKLIDFGIASAVQHDVTSIQNNFMAGTFNYMSPEAIQDPGDKTRTKVGYKSDVWSLGCILYNLLHKKTPFQHYTNNYRKLQVITNPNHTIAFPPVDGCPPALDVALRRCLTYDYKQRPTVDDLLHLPYVGGHDTNTSLLLRIQHALKPDVWSALKAQLSQEVPEMDHLN